MTNTVSNIVNYLVPASLLYTYTIHIDKHYLFSDTLESKIQMAGILRSFLPEILFFEIMSYIPDRLCHSCGDICGEATWCVCITRTIPNMWAGDDIYGLDRWCTACQDPESTCYCTCWRVRQIVDQFEREIKREKYRLSYRKNQKETKVSGRKNVRYIPSRESEARRARD